jgi:hypothetical protein
LLFTDFSKFVVQKLFNISKWSFQAELIDHFTWASKLNFKNTLFNIHPIKIVWQNVQKWTKWCTYNISCISLIQNICTQQKCRSELHSIGLIFQCGKFNEIQAKKFLTPDSVNSFHICNVMELAIGFHFHLLFLKKIITYTYLIKDN